MSLARYVLRPGCLHTTADGVEVAVGLPWYRSLPWASLSALSIALDERELNLSAATVDGAPFSSLAEREDYWHIQHRARVAVPAAVEVRRESELRVRMELLIPGPLSADGTPLPFLFEARQFARPREI